MTRFSSIGRFGRWGVLQRVKALILERSKVSRFGYLKKVTISFSLLLPTTVLLFSPEG
ncbi:hypothetical protein ZOSMA_3G00590 [Zostera marina]|uniref:Uncharacterized protein n=1 Tax=Zostera marina TaxID=29655 RepID=A0A0K9P3L2_ZOSMR|nr:hypothetical protein ZOSMA_3G00590 [Zostera marina]